MKVVITKLQYQKIVFNLLDVLYGPNISFKKDEDMFEILSDDGEEIFRVYTKLGRSKGCKKDMLVLSMAMQEIESYVPPTVLRKKLFSKTVLSYVNKKTGLDIDCIDFSFNANEYDNVNSEDRYRFNVKKNKKTESR
jgi:hypothetical protein